MKTLGSILYSELAPPTRGITYSYLRETEKIIDPKLSVEHTLTKKYEKHLGIGRNTFSIFQVTEPYIFWHSSPF